MSSDAIKKRSYVVNSLINVAKNMQAKQDLKNTRDVSHLMDVKKGEDNQNNDNYRVNQLIDALSGKDRIEFPLPTDINEIEQILAEADRGIIDKLHAGDKPKVPHFQDNKLKNKQERSLSPKSDNDLKKSFSEKSLHETHEIQKENIMKEIKEELKLKKQNTYSVHELLEEKSPRKVIEENVQPACNKVDELEAKIINNIENKGERFYLFKNTKGFMSEQLLNLEELHTNQSVSQYSGFPYEKFAHKPRNMELGVPSGRRDVELLDMWLDHMVKK